jgi:hypothetical protein
MTKDVQRQTFQLKVPQNIRPYAARPVTPLGEASGLTSTPVSEYPSRENSPGPEKTAEKENHEVNLYQYQPAMTWTHPSAFAAARWTSNYSSTQGAERETCVPAARTFKLMEEKLVSRKRSVSKDEEKHVEKGEMSGTGKENTLKDVKDGKTTD